MPKWALLHVPGETARPQTRAGLRCSSSEGRTGCAARGNSRREAEDRPREKLDRGGGAPRGHSPGGYGYGEFLAGERPSIPKRGSFSCVQAISHRHKSSTGTKTRSFEQFWKLSSRARDGVVARVADPGPGSRTVIPRTLGTTMQRRALSRPIRWNNDTCTPQRYAF